MRNAGPLQIHMPTPDLFAHVQTKFYVAQAPYPTYPLSPSASTPTLRTKLKKTH